MLSARFVRLCGLMALLTGVLWAINLRVTAGLVEWVGHAGGHLAVGLPAGLLALGGARLRETSLGRGGRLGDAGSLAILAGGALFAASALLEAAGAHPRLARLHDPAAAASAATMLLLVLGIVLLCVAAARARLLPRWGVTLVVIGAVVLLVAALGGLSGL